MTQRMRIKANFDKTPIQTRLGPSWYEFIEKSLYRYFTAQFDQAMFDHDDLNIPTIFIGEHAFDSIYTRDYSIILFTDHPSYVLPTYALEEAKALYVLDNEQYVKILESFKEAEILFNGEFKFIKEKHYPLTYEAPHRKKPLLGFMDFDYTKPSNFFALYMNMCYLYESPYIPNYDIAFYVYSTVVKEALDNFNFPKLPVHVLEAPYGFDSLEATPNVMLFPSKVTPFISMLSPNITPYHAKEIYEANFQGSNITVMENLFQNTVNQLTKKPDWI